MARAEDDLAKGKKARTPVLVWLPLALLMVVLMAGGIVHAAAGDYDLIDETPWWPSVVGVVCFAIPGVAWRRWLRAQPELEPKPKKLSSTPVLFMALLGGGMGGWGTFVVVNVARNEDVSVVEATVQLREKDRVQKGKSMRDVYYLKVDVDLVTGEPGQWYLDVSQWMYTNTAVDDVVQISVGAGYFGVRYVEDVVIYRKAVEPVELPSAAAAMRNKKSSSSR